MIQFLVDIALPVPLDRTFTYLVPPHLQAQAVPGSRALVPFGTKLLTGVIVALPAATSVPKLKPIRDILDSRPTFSVEMLRLTRWIADYYFAPWGEVLRSATPQGLGQESKRLVRLVATALPSALEETRTSAKKKHLILLSLSEKNPDTAAHLRSAAKASSIHAILSEMEQRGWIVLEDHVEKPKAQAKTRLVVRRMTDAEEILHGLQRKLLPKQQGLFDLVPHDGSKIPAADILKSTRSALSTLKSLNAKGLIAFSKEEVVRTTEYEEAETPSAITLNADQIEALKPISEAIAQSGYKTFLLHGITGSGKTQVYIEAIKTLLANGKTAIVLVPEISLTPQTVRRFRAHFGADVTVMHSQMSVGERYDAWRMAREGRARIVIGPRSAIFAPLENLGLIVVDEEHESSYKQFDATPRYNARDVAIVRAVGSGAVVLLGSATPSAESYYNATAGKYQLLRLPSRVDAAQLPRIDIVDMTKEWKGVYAKIKAEVKEKGGDFPKHLPRTSLSQLLKDQISDRLQKKEGTILLQNRRGFSHVVECYECGYVEKCDNCEVTMTYHSIKKQLRCHYCGIVRKPPSKCPQCGGIDFSYQSFGTQQVHEELHRLFPASVVLRMDLDTTGKKGAHDKMLQQFGRGEADILLGTQMVAKGLDFPRVTLVGVISADTQMLLPDFRSSERTFQLLTQVAGRAGRSTLAGEVVVQTLQPQHYSLKHVITHDFPGFYDEELAYRKELDYPPFSRIVLLEFKGKEEGAVLQRARRFAELLRKMQTDAFIVLGPADAAIPRIKSFYRKLIVIKNIKSTDPSGSRLRGVLEKALSLSDESGGKAAGVTMTIDVDPQGMM